MSVNNSTSGSSALTDGSRRKEAKQLTLHVGDPAGVHPSNAAHSLSPEATAPGSDLGSAGSHHGGMIISSTVGDQQQQQQQQHQQSSTSTGITATTTTTSSTTGTVNTTQDSNGHSGVVSSDPVLNGQHELSLPASSLASSSHSTHPSMGPPNSTTNTNAYMASSPAVTEPGSVPASTAASPLPNGLDPNATATTGPDGAMWVKLDPSTAAILSNTAWASPSSQSSQHNTAAASPGGVSALPDHALAHAQYAANAAYLARQQQAAAAAVAAAATSQQAASSGTMGGGASGTTTTSSSKPTGGSNWFISPPTPESTSFVPPFSPAPMFSPTTPNSSLHAAATAFPFGFQFSGFNPRVSPSNPYGTFPWAMPVSPHTSSSGLFNPATPRGMSNAAFQGASKQQQQQQQHQQQQQQHAQAQQQQAAMAAMQQAQAQAQAQAQQQQQHQAAALAHQHAQAQQQAHSTTTTTATAAPTSFPPAAINPSLAKDALSPGAENKGRVANKGSGTSRPKPRRPKDPSANQSLAAQLLPSTQTEGTFIPRIAEAQVANSPGGGARTQTRHKEGDVDPGIPEVPQHIVLRDYSKLTRAEQLDQHRLSSALKTAEAEALLDAVTPDMVSAQPTTSQQFLVGQRVVCEGFTPYRHPRYHVSNVIKVGAYSVKGRTTTTWIPNIIIETNLDVVEDVKTGTTHARILEKPRIIRGARVCRRYLKKKNLMLLEAHLATGSTQNPELLPLIRYLNRCEFSTRKDYGDPYPQATPTKASPSSRGGRRGLKADSSDGEAMAIDAVSLDQAFAAAAIQSSSPAPGRRARSVGATKSARQRSNSSTRAGGVGKRSGAATNRNRRLSLGAVESVLPGASSARSL